MQKNYIAPQTEVMQFGSELMQDTIGIIHHSGGTNTGNQGSFLEEEIA